MPNDDFVLVRMTAEMAAAAGSSPMTVSNGRRSATFTGTDIVKVEKSYEWNAWLSTLRMDDGTPRFELAPAAAPAATKPAPAAPTDSEPTK